MVPSSIGEITEGVPATLSLVGAAHIIDNRYADNTELGKRFYIPLDALSSQGIEFTIEFG